MEVSNAMTATMHGMMAVQLSARYKQDTPVLEQQQVKSQPVKRFVGMELTWDNSLAMTLMS